MQDCKIANANSTTAGGGGRKAVHCMGQTIKPNGFVVETGKSMGAAGISIKTGRAAGAYKFAFFFNKKNIKN